VETRKDNSRTPEPKKTRGPEKQDVQELQVEELEERIAPMKQGY
jgi:uncharacterized small protein (DUF1192 family)